jgi:hypothetical protein
MVGMSSLGGTPGYLLFEPRPVYVAEVAGAHGIAPFERTSIDTSWPAAIAIRGSHAFSSIRGSLAKQS